jgi:hypothetical protein
LKSKKVFIAALFFPVAWWAWWFLLDDFIYPPKPGEFREGMMVAGTLILVLLATALMLLIGCAIGVTEMYRDESLRTTSNKLWLAAAAILFVGSLVVCSTI